MKARLSLLLVLAAAAFSPLIEGGTTHTPVLVLKLFVIALLAVKLKGLRDGGALLLVRSPLDAAVMLITTAAIYSAIIAPYKYMALVWVQLIVFYVLFYYLARGAIKEAGEGRLTVPAVIVMGAGQTAVSIYQWFSGAARVKGTFFNPNMAAGYIVVTILLALSLLVHGKSRIKKGFYGYLLGLYIAAGVTAILLSGSRGAVLALVAGVFVVVWFRSRIFAIACVLALTAAVVVVPNPVRERAFSGEPLAYTRTEIWKSAVRMAADHPQGIGLGNFKYFYDRYAFPVPTDIIRYGKKATTAHNELLHFTAEAGIPGLAAILFGLFSLARGLLASAGRPAGDEQRPVGVWALAGFAAYTAHSLVDANFHEPGLVFLFILMVCMGLEAGAGEPAKGREVIVPQGKGNRPLALGAVFAVLLLVWAVRPELARHYQEESAERMKDNEPATAAELASKAVFIEPSDATAHESLASAMFALFAAGGEEERFTVCLDELAQAETLNPNNSKYPELSAYVKETAAARAKDPAVRMRLLESAYSDLERAGEADPYSAGIMYRKARISLQLNDKAGAEDTLRKILEIEPNYLRARYALAKIYRDTGRKRLSIEECYSIIKAHERLSRGWMNDGEKDFTSVDMDAVRALVRNMEA